MTPGVNGFLTPFGGEALREPLLILRDDVPRRAAMSGAAVDRSLRYAWDRVAAEYFDVLAGAAS